MTARREAILRELKNSNAHPTAEELFETIRTRIPNISLGTIYRNLEILAKAGYINVLEGGAQRRYDAIDTPHYHIRCIHCGRMKDVPVKMNRTLEEGIREKVDYSVLGHRLEFFGICPKCKQKEEINAKP
jgi:Fe2+ or Zn2+ uptake regulation protein